MLCAVLLCLNNIEENKFNEYQKLWLEIKEEPVF